MKFIPAIALAVLALAAAVGPPGLKTQAGANCSVDGAIDGEEAAMLDLINQHRQQNGVAALELSDTLNQSAAWKSQHMADNSYFAHDDTPIGRTWSQRLRDCGYTFNTYLGENIAAGNGSAAAAFDQWRNSPGHDANMLSTNYAAIGIGRAFNDDSPFGWYWTTDFGGFADGFTPPTTPTPTPMPTATPIPLPPASGIDSDGDGCDDAYEGGGDPARGGLRDPANPWDFFDTPDAGNTRDRLVAATDIARVVQRFGATGDPTVDLFSAPPAAPSYHPAFDRTPAGGAGSFLLGPADGSITASDISLVTAQFGHTCAGGF